MEMTVNELMVLMKTVKGRMGQLQALQQSVAKKESFFDRGENKLVEPQYDVKQVDKKIVEIQNFLYFADAKVKQSNAVTKVDIVCSVDSLLSPLQ
jgi:hypothetical protein